MFTRTQINDRGVVTDGVHFFKPCTRCDGTGTMPYNIYAGKCFKCGGYRLNRNANWIDQAMTREEAEKWTEKLNKAAAKREEKRIAIAAEAVAKRDAWLAENAAIVAKIEEFGTWGILEDFRGKILSGETLSEKQLALAESLVKREEEKRAKNAEVSYMGEVGQKIEFEGTVRATFNYESAFGYVYGVIIASGENIVVTKGTSAFHMDAEKGQTFKLRATVKAHEERDGVKQTIVIRPKAL